MRLKLMASFFRECADNPRDCVGAYPIEALRRAIVGEILMAMAEYDYERREAAAAAQYADRSLRQLLHACDFIWSPMLEPVYPRETFWWLYGSPAA